jgi:2,4-dienoyl-CoA reductase-like NADH-dependent reductase (Old Yellow Enzyme family)
MPSLFDPLQLGELAIPNRIIMAPLTRCRAGVSRVPNLLMAEYYRQRASAGLIISEATVVTPDGVGYAGTPGIWSAQQVEGWRLVTHAVHAAGGRIFLQLWHVGRISHPMFLDGRLPVAPSAVAANGNVNLVNPKVPYPVPRALEHAEIAGIIEAFGAGASNAQLAGFDGVELHGANGYLLDQFLQDSTNRRDDEYGGPIENRARLLLQVTDAVLKVWSPGRVGVHLAPRGDSHSMGDSNLGALFGYVAQQLGRRKLAFICAREHPGPDRIGPQLKQAFGGNFIANEQFSPDSASKVLASGEAEAVAFGKSFLANPDLPRRLKLNAALNEAQSATFYADGAVGYTDYPSLLEA